MENEDAWPICSFVGEIPNDDKEVKKEMHSCELELKPEGNMVDLSFSKSSSWSKLKKAAAWLLSFRSWFLGNLAKHGKKLEDFKRGMSTVEELDEAEHSIMLCFQNESFPEELTSLISWSTV